MPTLATFATTQKVIKSNKNLETVNYWLLWVRIGPNASVDYMLTSDGK